MDDTTRTFIAVELDKSTQKSLQEVQDKLKELNINVRWVKPHNIHLTLKFLGDIPSNKLQKIIHAFPSFFDGFSPFKTHLSHIGVFPDAKNPKVIWVGIKGNTEKLQKLAQAAQTTLVRFKFRKGKQKFVPHLTLGRVRSSKNLKLFQQALEDFAMPPCHQTIRHIKLFKSTLTSEGSIYEPLACVELK